MGCAEDGFVKALVTGGGGFLGTHLFGIVVRPLLTVLLDPGEGSVEFCFIVYLLINTAHHLSTSSPILEPTTNAIL